MLSSLSPYPTPGTGRFALPLDSDANFREVDSSIDCSILSSVSSVLCPNGGSHVEGIDHNRDYQVDSPWAYGARSDKTACAVRKIRKGTGE
jgi:hypothetical protein